MCTGTNISETPLMPCSAKTMRAADSSQMMAIFYQTSKCHILQQVCTNFPKI